MAGTGEKVNSLRLNRFEMKRLTWAIVLSLLLHLFGWGGYELGKKTGLWHRLHWPERLKLAQKKSPPPPVQDPGTPAGTYNVTVTATNGSASSITGFTLFLQ